MGTFVRLHHIKLLIVEDDNAHLDLMLLKMKKYQLDYEIQSACTLHEAMTTLKKWTPDIVLSDMRLPDGEGIEILDVYETNPFPLVLITAFGDAEQAVETMKKGVSDYVIKSNVFFDDLPHVIDRNLKQFQLKQENEATQNALLQSEQKYRVLIDNSLQGIAILKNKHVTFCNEAGLDILKYTFKELFSLSLLGLARLIQPDDRSIFFSAMKQERDSEQTIQRFEFRILDKCGAVKWLQVLSNNIILDGEHAIEIFFVDISKQKSVEAQLKKSETHLSDAQRIGKIGSWDLDMTNERIWWSDELYNMLGVLSDAYQPTLETMIHFVVPEDQDRVRQALTLAIEEGTPYENEFKIVRGDGQIRMLRSQGQLFRNAEGKPIRWIATAQDITEKREEEKVRSQLERQLMQVQRLETIGRLAGGIAHDFNNILAPMSVYLDMAMEELDQAGRTYADLVHVEKGIQWAKELVQQVLTFSRQEEQEKSSVDIYMVVKEALDLLQAAIPSYIHCHKNINPSQSFFAE